MLGEKKYKYEKPDNLVVSFENAVTNFASNPFIGEKDNKGEYKWLTYGEIGDRVDNLRTALSRLGVKKGDKIGIISSNSSNWVVCAFATYGLGSVFVPMYESELYSLWCYVIKESEIKILFVSKKEIYEKVASLIVTIDTLEKVVLLDSDDVDDIDGIKILEEEASVHSPVASIIPSPYDTAAIIYTSGTTGDPKGVILSHGNFTSNARAGSNLYPQFSEDSVSISILPWAHSYGQVAELYNFIQFGGSIGIMGSVLTLMDDLQKVRPTFLIAVPKVFNKIHKNVLESVGNRGPIVRKLFSLGIKYGIEKNIYSPKGKLSFFKHNIYKIADKKIFSIIKAKFGGRIDGAVTASADIKQDTVEFFFGLGISLYNAYGLTECSPAVTMNGPEFNHTGSVGKPLEHIDVSIVHHQEIEGENGEIIVHGPNVMKGYFNKPDENKKIFTEDGGIKTGDCGYIDENGFLFITGRIKEQYKLVNGKYIFPASIEFHINSNKYIVSSYVRGRGENFNIAIIVPDFNALSPFLEKYNLPVEPEKIIKNKTVKHFILKQIHKELNGKFGKYEIPKDIFLVDEPFLIENGILTPTFKLKRRKLEEKYADIISSLYKEF